MVYVAAVLCIAEILTMTGVATYVALLPVLRAEWQRHNTLAGAISGAFFAGYMAAVPILVSLTDRIAARRVYVCACGALALGSIAFAYTRGTGGRDARAGAARRRARRHLHARAEGAVRSHVGTAPGPRDRVLHVHVRSRQQPVAVDGGRAAVARWVAHRVPRGGRRTGARRGARADRAAGAAVRARRRSRAAACSAWC